MNRIVIVGLALIVCSSSSCSTARSAKDARSEILRLDAEWCHDVNESRDVDRILSYWSDDAVVMPPGHPSLAGKDAIREFVVESLSTPGFKISWKTDQVFVDESGDMAYALGTNHVTINDEDGTPIEIDAKTATVWRNEPGLGWKCVLDVWNESEPREPSDD